MKLEKLAAALLLTACVAAAAGSWYKQIPQTNVPAVSLKGLLGEEQIARINITGMILDDGAGGLGGGGTTSAQTVLRALARVREDGCKVVLLQLNSPGGTASGAQEVYDELLRLKRDKHVVVIAAMGDLAASGAYYIAAAADEIVANPATITGSIGVIMHTQNWQGLMDKLGVRNGAIKSAPMKDIGSPDRPMSWAERRLLQEMIDDTYQQFLEAVSAGRHIPMARLKPLADGRIFTGRQAQKVHLVDKLGNMRFAEQEARTLGKLPADARVKDYSAGDWEDLLGDMFSRSRVGPLSQILGTSQALIQSGALNKVPLMLYE